MSKPCKLPKKIRVLIVGDGYTADDSGKFNDRADEFIDQVKKEDWYNQPLFAEVPSHSSLGGHPLLPLTVGDHFEFRKEMINSKSQGVGISSDCEDFYPKQVENAFGSRFCRGRFREREKDVPFRILRGDIRKVHACLYQKARWDYLLILANTTDILPEKCGEGRAGRSKDCKTYHKRFLRGGYGDIGNKVAWVAANSCDWYSVALHELGHIIFNLHEEYDYFGDDSSDDLHEYPYEDWMDESNIIPTRRVETLLERLRITILRQKDINFKITDDSKDYIVNKHGLRSFERTLAKVLRPKKSEIPCKDREETEFKHLFDSEHIFEKIRLTRKEKTWFNLVHQSGHEDHDPGKDTNWYYREKANPCVIQHNKNYRSGLFRYRKVKSGPFKGWFRIRFNVFWKQLGYRMHEDQNSIDAYHRRKDLQKFLCCDPVTYPNYNPQRIGFYEGAGTFNYGLARPQWECLMRETKSINYRCRGRLYNEAENDQDRIKIHDDTTCEWDTKSKPPPGSKDKCGCPNGKSDYNRIGFCKVCIDSISRKVLEYHYTGNSNDAGVAWTGGNLYGDTSLS